MFTVRDSPRSGSASVPAAACPVRYKEAAITDWPNAGQVIANAIGVWEQPSLPPLPAGEARLMMLTPGGHRFGQAPCGRLWQYEGFRHIFRIITAVWGVGFLLEAALRVAIVYNTSTGTALSLSKVMPYIWVGIFMAWTVAYGRYQRKKGEQMMAAAAVVEGPATSDADPQPADITKAAGQA